MPHKPRHPHWATAQWAADVSIVQNALDEVLGILNLVVIR